MTNPAQSAILLSWSEEVHFHLPQSWWAVRRPPPPRAVQFL
nr:MAG TPA: hypothetical protein [Caudoviricetes sp.]